MEGCFGEERELTDPEEVVTLNAFGLGRLMRKEMMRMSSGPGFGRERKKSKRGWRGLWSLLLLFERLGLWEEAEEEDDDDDDDVVVVDVVVDDDGKWLTVNGDDEVSDSCSFVGGELKILS